MIDFIAEIIAQAWVQRGALIFAGSTSLQSPIFSLLLPTLTITTTIPSHTLLESKD